MEKIKYALIGCGRISPNHIAAVLNNQDNLELVAVCDPIADHMERILEPLGEKASEVQRFCDYHEMLRKVQPSLCAIATESGSTRQSLWTVLMRDVI